MFEANPSHLIVHVTNTEESVAFFETLFDSTVADDHTFSSPGLDAIFGRQGVVIRSTFIDAAGYRLHTIETLDVVRPRPAVDEKRERIGITGMSFQVTSLDEIHQRAEAGGLAPTPIHEFTLDFMDKVSRMFFVRDPDGTNIELIEQV